MIKHNFSIIGVSFDTSLKHLMTHIHTAMQVFVYGAEGFINDVDNEGESLVPHLSCDSTNDDEDGPQQASWTLGEKFHKY